VGHTKYETLYQLSNQNNHLNLSFIIVFAATGFFHGAIFRLLEMNILKLEEIQFFALQD